MADPYAAIAEAEPTLQKELARILELRAAHSGQRAMREAYFAGLELPADARVLEVGSGTGAVTRALAELVPEGRALGVDPSPIFLEKARELGRGYENLSFEEADARALPFDDRSLTAVVFHTTLSHIPRPERALAEAFRVLEPAGQLVVFDGDYATTTVAAGDLDPLQACADAAVAALVHDRWLLRRLPRLLRESGFEVTGVDSYGFVETEEPEYMLTIVDRGADALVSAGQIALETADALKAEARRRIAAGEFFGHIAYVALHARRPRGEAQTSAPQAS
jgi:ubiquinone/menaquinone biosynthesis C-methylase UbiE